jgi:uncharacterized protein YciI
MASELPEGIAIEQIWAVEATYAPDAPEKRPTVRAEHLTRMVGLRDRGVVIEVGGYADWSGSLILVRANSEEAALEVVRGDVYWSSGVWSDAKARPLGRAVRSEELAGREG